MKLPISAMSELFPSQNAEISAKYISFCSAFAFHLKNKMGRMTVSREVLLKSESGWQKFNSKSVACPFGAHIYHYRSRHSPDLIWESSKSSSQ